MRVFVTGASGWIGSAAVAELIDAGHDVVGLARSQASAAALTAAGVAAVRGSLDDLDVLREASAAADGVIHLAFKHDVAFEQGDFKAAADADRRATEAMGEALVGTGKPFVLASGTPVEPGRVATENDGHDVPPPGSVPPEMSGLVGRLATAEWTLALADRGVRSSVVRLPRTNHGEGDKGFIATLVGIARDKGVAGHYGDGTNRWPAVHRLDSAHMFRVALEKASAGSTLHAVADEGVSLRDIAEVIGRHLGLEVASVPPEEAGGHFGWLAGVLAADQPASSVLSQELTGWRPTQPGLLDDLDKGHYFRVA
ncbi:SDR family oxidoreductase [Streptomyces beihaiensis]|uniref:SDR family oxidoreductase n=1 Tax=Streptomyces beihaiensis TaxID=2984495 RepID=A0ABT3TQ48_9ACTN|nr:SDR family oxidoreductase [Streptomyces beihaiensis]MCX3058240.1 SDR family oxidoreductase [Streptomyces beihaiensis]